MLQREPVRRCRRTRSCSARAVRAAATARARRTCWSLVAPLDVQRRSRELAAARRSGRPAAPTSARRTCRWRRCSPSRCCRRRRGSTTSTPSVRALREDGRCRRTGSSTRPEPGSLTAFELTTRAYRQVAHVVGDDEFVARAVPVTVVPARLLDGLRPGAAVTKRASVAARRPAAWGHAAGRVVSVNVAVVRTDPWTRVKSGRSGIDKRPVDGPVRLAVVRGGRRHDLRHEEPRWPGPGRLRLRVDDLAFWTAELGGPSSRATWGRTSRWRASTAPRAVIGERWQVGDAVLRVRGPRIPCRVFAGFLDVPDLIKRFFAAGRPGGYLAVERAGRVLGGRPGDGAAPARPRRDGGGPHGRDRRATASSCRGSRRPGRTWVLRGREWLDTVLAGVATLTERFA